MPRFRIGCVPFLNAKPLVAYYATPEGEAEAEVIFGPPSQLAAWVDRGEVDVALASSYFAAADPGYAIAPGISISSLGAVDSVRLFSKVPLPEIRTLALDESSMTSNHLALLLLAKKYGCRPAAATMPPDLTRMLSNKDAAVLIGDLGMESDGDGLTVLDLGAAWNELSGLPFVWAVWLGREGLSDELAASLLHAKDYGMRHIEDIARAESERLNWPYGRCLRYVAEVIDYDLTDLHIQGFRLYRDLCAEAGFVGRISEAAPR